ncbi:MAG: IS110 family transposase [Gammaproteobacteria bacterium]|nr:IS110 family transposase [Gammaproteobacteria bacterium]
MPLTTLGIDLAKNVFHLHGVDEHGICCLQKVVKRNNLLKVIAKLPTCLIGMEACGGAHHWARAFREFGHDVKIINPQYVKPYVKTQKNDYNDAQAICEAVSRPHMHFVPVKEVEHQDILALHRIRSRLVGSRTALVNQIRGLLGEYGIVMPQQIGQVRRQVPEILEDAENGLSDLFRQSLRLLYEELGELDGRVEVITKKINTVCTSNPNCQRLSTMRGIGPIGATALVAALGDASTFKNGRQVSAWLGLVPRQYSSGGKTVLLGITKRGDRYLRMMLIHGARSTVIAAARKTDPLSRWINALRKRRGFNKTCVAVANKNARIAWALLVTGEDYRYAV